MQEPLAEHRAKSAIGYANDMAERFFHHLGLQAKYPGPHGTARYRDDLARACPDFALVRDVADNTKHWVINRRSRLISRADQSGPKQLTLDETDFPIDEIDDWDTNEQLVVALDDGSQRTLRSILASVMAFWIAELQRHGL